MCVQCEHWTPNIHRAALWRTSDQLFVLDRAIRGLPASIQMVSKCIVETMSLAYEVSGQQYPLSVRAHSTRSMAASTALLLGVFLKEVCDVVG